VEPPPQAEIANKAVQVARATSKRFRLCPLLRNEIENTPNNRAIAMEPEAEIRLSIPPLATVPPELTVKVIAAGFVFVIEILVGLPAHCIPAGTFVQEVVRVPVNPPVGVTVS